MNNKNKEILLLIVIVGFALGLRLLYFFEMAPQFLFNKLILDAHYYDQWAREIITGNWIGRDVFAGMPLYAYFLALIYTVFGPSVLIVKLMQFIIGSAIPIFVYLISKRLFDKRIIGIIAAFIAASYNMFIFYEGELVDSTISLFLYLLTIYLLLLAGEKHKGKLYFCAGVSLGLSALSRAGILLWIPFVIFWIIFLVKGNPLTPTLSPKGRGKRVKRWVSIISKFILGIFIVVFSVTLRNYLTAKDFVFITAHSGINFYIGNNENADGMFGVPEVMSSNSEDLMKDAKFFAERDAGKPLRASQVSAYWGSKAVKFIYNSPLKFLSLMVKKFTLFWDTYELPDIQNYYFIKHEFNFFKLPLWGAIIIIPLSVLGMLLGIVNWRKLFLLYTFVASYTFSIILYFVNSRYRLTLIPVLIIFSAYCLWWFFLKIKKKEYNKAIPGLLVFLVLFILTNSHTKKIDFSDSYANMGDILLKEGDFDKADIYYNKAIQENSNNAKVYNALAVIYLEKNEYNLAEEMFNKTLEIEANNARAYSNLGLLYLKKGDYSLALEKFKQALDINPGLSEAHNNLAVIYIHSSEYEKAEKELKAAIVINAMDISAHHNLGLVYLKQGLTSEAAQEFRWVLSAAPTHKGAIDGLSYMGYTYSTSEETFGHLGGVK